MWGFITYTNYKNMSFIWSIFFQSTTLLFLLLHTIESHQNDLVLRPSPTEDLFATSFYIQEHKGIKYDPKGKDLNIKTLRLKLGKDFDSQYMSIHKPNIRNKFNSTISKLSALNSLPFKRNSKGRLIPIGEIPETLKSLHYDTVEIGDGTKLRTRLSSKLRKKIIQFLWSYTYCPIYNNWRDLGIRFWPRWLKEGSCQNGSTEKIRSCSIPPGMSCKPSKIEYKVLLRWHCQDWDRGKHCRWVNIEHPVVTECSCNC